MKTREKMSALMRNLGGGVQCGSGGANIVKQFKGIVRRPVTGARLEMMRMKIQQHIARTHH